jgi:hypothetical protein
MLRKILLNKQSVEKNILIMKNKKIAAYLSSYEIHDILMNSTCVWFGKSKIKKVHKIEFVEFPWNSQENAKASTKTLCEIYGSRDIICQTKNNQHEILNGKIRESLVSNISFIFFLCHNILQIFKLISIIYWSAIKMSFNENKVHFQWEIVKINVLL